MICFSYQCSAPTCISIPLNNLEWFFKNISITWNLGQNCWDKTENLFYSEKPLSPEINVVWKDTILILVGKGENLEFENFSHFLNLLDFKLLSQEVMPKDVRNFQNIKVNNSIRTSAMVGFYISKRVKSNCFDDQIVRFLKS